MNSLWKFNTFVPRGGSMFGFLVIFLSLSACLYSKLHEARNQCFAHHGIAECLRVTVMTPTT